MEDKMKSLGKYQGLGLIPVIILCWAISGFAENINVEIDAVNVIRSANQDTIHILAKPDLNLQDTTMHINRAILSATISPETQDTLTYLSIRLHPITTDWDLATATWNNPWTEPGGDYDKTHFGERLITKVEDQLVKIDITDLYMRWFDGRLPYYGFLIKISRSSWDQFTIVRNGNDPYATLNIHYSVY
jgi:hypothetical protein